MTRRIPYWRFLMMDGFAALISVPVWVYLGYFGARNREWLMHMVHRGQAGILITLALAGIVIGIVYWRRKRAARAQA